MEGVDAFAQRRNKVGPRLQQQRRLDAFFQHALLPIDGTDWRQNIGTSRKPFVDHRCCERARLCVGGGRHIHHDNLRAFTHPIRLLCDQQTL